MAASDHLSHMQSGKFVGDPSTVPPEFGSQPIPEGMVRINHYTSVGAVESIKQQGLLQSANRDHVGDESFVFATAGKPEGHLMDRAPVVEGYADPSRGGQLDIGEYYGQGGNLQDHIEHMESRRSTVTLRGNLPPSQILAVHEPWHERYRYFANHPGMEKKIVAGDYDYVHDMDDYGPALDATKKALAAKVMLGGKLGDDD